MCFPGSADRLTEYSAEMRDRHDPRQHQPTSAESKDRVLENRKETKILELHLQPNVSREAAHTAGNLCWKIHFLDFIAAFVSNSYHTTWRRKQ